MREQFKLLHVEEASKSHMTGTLPIMGCFATSGIEIKAYFISDHHACRSARDHRMHVINFSSQLIIGADLPRKTKRSGENFKWNVPPTSKKYTKDLVKECKSKQT